MIRPSLCFVGPMLHPAQGRPPAPAIVLAQHFESIGFRVMSTSPELNRWVRVADQVTTLLRKRRTYDVAMLQVFSGAGFYAAAAATALLVGLRVPVVMTLHGGNLPSFARANPRLVRATFARAEVLVAPSRYLASELAWLGFPIEVIPNLVDVDTYPYRPRAAVRPRLLWMRTFHAHYNPQLAVRVLAAVRRAHPDATLTMGGNDKGELAATKALAAELGVGDAIDFVGFIHEADKRAIGQSHDVYLNTNRVDNMPVSVVEMAAMGLPIVATRVGGIPYLLSDGENALLVPDGDVAAMTAAVERLLVEPGLGERLSRAARALALASGWDQVRPGWERALARAWPR